MYDELQENGFRYYIKNNEAYIIGLPKTDETTLIVPEYIGGVPVVEVVFYMASLHGYNSIYLSKNIKFFDACCLDENLSNISIDETNEYFSVKTEFCIARTLRNLFRSLPQRRILMPHALMA